MYSPKESKAGDISMREVSYRYFGIFLVELYYSDPIFIIDFQVLHLLRIHWEREESFVADISLISRVSLDLLCAGWTAVEAKRVQSWVATRWHNGADKGREGKGVSYLVSELGWEIVGGAMQMMRRCLKPWKNDLQFSSTTTCCIIVSPKVKQSKGLFPSVIYHPIESLPMRWWMEILKIKSSIRIEIRAHVHWQWVGRNIEI